MRVQSKETYQQPDYSQFKAVSEAATFSEWIILLWKFPTKLSFDT